MDIESWILFAEEKWYIILAAIIVLFIVIKLVKTLMKWLIVIAVVAVLIYYGSSYSDTLRTAGDQIIDLITQEDLVDLALDEIKEYVINEAIDGEFIIKNDNVTIQGEEDSKVLTITYGGETYTIEMNDEIKKLLEDSR
ncbi:hypothetical protein [Chengkuizengella axinellae]|uniref:Uncharacterized protein n=1 Tax=Chengkuizengella axinellae TaxID=3064388 RepID=A0ABT9IT70_9BACL|nr:hypothetical protein [Chengkuizengella sp. 2205SS18-9]MDP5272546.1 hypothetical protein [Chengkuizengella sp. 2205SS18-9]